MPPDFSGVDFGGLEDRHLGTDGSGVDDLSFDNDHGEMGKEQDLPQLVAGKCFMNVKSHYLEKKVIKGNHALLGSCWKS